VIARAMFTHLYTASLDSQLQAYKNQVNTIPDTIFLIWIGDDIPETVSRPYQSNIIKHKRLNPDSSVQILVSKPMLVKSGRWDTLVAKFLQQGVELRDIHATCAHMINFCVVEKLMSDKKDYVWASDILRLALIFHEGGWYFDTDLVPHTQLGKVKALYGFLQIHSHDEIKKSGFCLQAAMKGHFIYLYASVISRLFYECAVRDKPDFLNTRFASIRQKTITHLSGFPISNLLAQTNIGEFYQANRHDFSFALKEKCDLFSDCSWLDDFKKLREFKIIKEMGLKSLGNVAIGPDDLREIITLQARLKREGDKLSAFHDAVIGSINEASLKQLCQQYFSALFKEFVSPKSYFESVNKIIASEFSYRLSPHFWTKPTPLNEAVSSKLKALDGEKSMMIYSI
jgi:hypothetical protein